MPSRAASLVRCVALATVLIVTGVACRHHRPPPPGDGLTVKLSSGTVQGDLIADEVSGLAARRFATRETLPRRAGRMTRLYLEVLGCST